MGLLRFGALNKFSKMSLPIVLWASKAIATSTRYVPWINPDRSASPVPKELLKYTTWKDWAKEATGRSVVQTMLFQTISSRPLLCSTKTRVILWTVCLPSCLLLTKNCSCILPNVVLYSYMISDARPVLLNRRVSSHSKEAWLLVSVKDKILTRFLQVVLVDMSVFSTLDSMWFLPHINTTKSTPLTHCPYSTQIMKIEAEFNQASIGAISQVPWLLLRQVVHLTRFLCSIWTPEISKAFWRSERINLPTRMAMIRNHNLSKIRIWEWSCHPSTESQL